MLLLPGKSLDTIMELKELAGDRDMFDVLKPVLLVEETRVPGETNQPSPSH
jgi:hypothetical protein